MARQKLSMSEIPIARRHEAIGRGPGPWKEAPDPKKGIGGMAKPSNKKLDLTQIFDFPAGELLACRRCRDPAISVSKIKTFLTRSWG